SVAGGANGAGNIAVGGGTGGVNNVVGGTTGAVNGTVAGTTGAVNGTVAGTTGAVNSTVAGTTAGARVGVSTQPPSASPSVGAASSQGGSTTATNGLKPVGQRLPGWLAWLPPV